MAMESFFLPMVIQVGRIYQCPIWEQLRFLLCTRYFLLHLWPRGSLLTSEYVTSGFLSQNKPQLACPSGHLICPLGCPIISAHPLFNWFPIAQFLPNTMYWLMLGRQLSIEVKRAFVERALLLRWNSHVEILTCYLQLCDLNRLFSLSVVQICSLVKWTW